MIARALPDAGCSASEALVGTWEKRLGRFGYVVHSLAMRMSGEVVVDVRPSVRPSRAGKSKGLIPLKGSAICR